jgi:hypothetical protein
MVKRANDTLDASLGSVLDTSGISGEPSQNDQSDASPDVREFYYRPEMGTVVVNHDLPRRDDS